MKKPEILFLFSFLILAVAMITACTQVQQPDNSNAVITYKFYGGFVAPAYAIQELVVTKDTATFTITAADGNITQRFEKNLTREQYDAIVKVFLDNNFASYGDRYD